MIDDELRRVLTLTDPSGDESLAAAAASGNVDVLVAVAVRTGDRRLLARAAEWATTSRARQVVALATAHLAGDHERFDALVRDHLVEHPDHIVAAWLAAVHRDHPVTPTTPDRRTPC